MATSGCALFSVITPSGQVSRHMNLMERGLSTFTRSIAATGNSAVAAIDRVKVLKPRSIKFMCLLTCPEGVITLNKAHPDVAIYTAAVDRQLNDHGYILPGLGDAGDRIFGTQ